nr:intron-binding protein aquarius [Tanacetum cinerariifolium]
MIRTVRVALDTAQYHMDVSDIAKIGFANPFAAQWTNTPDLLKTVDFRDTFPDADHQRECFSDYQGMLWDTYISKLENQPAEYSHQGNNIDESNLRTQMPFNQEFPLYRNSSPAIDRPHIRMQLRILLDPCEVEASNGIRELCPWDRDNITWVGRDEGVGTVQVRWDAL